MFVRILETVKLNGISNINSNGVADLFSKHFNSIYSDSSIDYDLPNTCSFDTSKVEK